MGPGETTPDDYHKKGLMTIYPVVSMVILYVGNSASGNTRSNTGDIHDVDAREKSVLQQLLDAMNEIRKQNVTIQ